MPRPIATSAEPTEGGTTVTELERAVRDVVIANRILANEGVVDAYGHVSVRHPSDPTRFLLSRSLAPALVERGDVIEFDLEGKAVGGDARPPYLERFIHGRSTRHGPRSRRWFTRTPRRSCRSRSRRPRSGRWC